MEKCLAFSGNWKATWVECKAEVEVVKDKPCLPGHIAFRFCPDSGCILRATGNHCFMENGLKGGWVEMTKQ